MNIPDPKADRGERVRALNYRKRETTWEEGEVVGLEYANLFGSFRWRYTVVLDRRASESGGIISLHVADDRIERLTQP